MWLSVSGILVLFLYVSPTVSRDTSSDGIIKEAILSLARIIRDNSQKTERHEARERHQSENLRKAVEDLTKRVSTVDTFAAHFSKIEDRISEIEQLISQRDERERIQMQKTVDSIQNLETRLEVRMNEIKDTIAAVEPTERTTMTESVSASDIISKLNNTEAHFLEKVVQIQTSLNTMATENREEAAMQAEKQRVALSERDEKERIQNEATKMLIENLENHLKTRLDGIENTVNGVNECILLTQQTTTTASDIIAKLNDTEVHFLEKVAQIQSDLDTMAVENKGEAATQAEKLQTVFTEVQNISGKLRDIESSLAEVNEAARRGGEKPKVDIEAIIQVQSREIRKITNLVEDTLNRIADLPMSSEVRTMHNETQAALQEAKYALKTSVSDGINGIINSIGEKNNEIKETIGDLRSDLGNNTQRVDEQLNGLAKGQGVMVSTADEILDTKRKVEYGVHRILSETHELIKDHGTAVDKTLNDKFGEISHDIIENQSTTLINLTTKMEEELNKVWRQITAMYQQMTANGAALEKLNQQNEAYINGTISTMDGMETKVGDIKERMSKVDANLNYLLGRLSLVTQQFNQIKTGLGTALDDIKISVTEIQEKAKGLSHPGPHPIPNNDTEFYDADSGQFTLA